MIEAAINFVCHGCGAIVDAALALPFRCPQAGAAGDDIDHLLVPMDGALEDFVARNDLGPADNPFLRYRSLLSPYRLARFAKLSDATWEEIVGRLDDALVAVDGGGFRVTPMAVQPALSQSLGLEGALWVKDETGNVGGSHKARHLMGVMLYLRVLKAARLGAGEGIEARRLAIASCGNAALAAAVIARAADWPLDVFIPADVSPKVVNRLKDLGARITVCDRDPAQPGDPCFLRFREAIGAGAIPFGVQGSENGLAIEGGRTLAFEMAETFRSAQQTPDAVFVQVGGGALASAIAQGFSMAAKIGIITRAPRIVVVQAAGCAPLDRAWQRMDQIDLDQVVHHRHRFMWPWEAAPASVAHGILDDETYDWFEIVKFLRLGGGHSLVVHEEALVRAHELACRQTGLRVSATGSAGLAGLLAVPLVGSAAVIFSGVDR